MNCISSSNDNTAAPLCRPSDTFATMIKAPLHPFDRVRSTAISVERHGLSLFEDLSREMDEFDDDDDSTYDSDIDESEHALEEDEGDVSFGVSSAMIKAPLHSVDRLRSTNVSVERHCLSSLFEDLSREIDDFVYDDDDDDSIYDSGFEFEQQAKEEGKEVDNIILSSSDDSIRAVVAVALQEDKHQQDEDEHLSPSSSSRLIVSSARSSNNDGDDDKSRSAAPPRSKVQGAEDNKRGPVVVAVEETRDGDTMTMTLAAKAVELSSSSPPLQHWRATMPRRLAFPRRWLEEDRACIRRR